ncbi:GNAT family N-acetyltransferase [Jatrophihabitans sp.]|uniref:GNAT family N-acetyltransferase n=1 Tax=Jatrophihabitans sp. TaxID=1932789 RepID=UPI0030C6E8EA|nr:GCN5-related N-acetyltransferase [Jatrophihabitans sp.]
MTTLRPAPPQSAPFVESLGAGREAEVTALLDADPIVNVTLAARLAAARSLIPAVLGGQVLGVRDSAGQLGAAVFNGGNLLPIGGQPAAWSALAREVASGRRACTSIVGRRESVAAMWDVLGRYWEAARAIRAEQPLLLIDDARLLPDGDPWVRAIRPSEGEAYLYAAAAMFTEELGISPLVERGGAAYRRRIGALIAAGLAYGLVGTDGRIVFKADLGAVSAHTCQIQGVWVRPDLRGRGVGTAALATVIRHALTLAPTVSLYVNGFNEPARRMYDTLGMRQVATLSTVLF